MNIHLLIIHFLDNVDLMQQKISLIGIKVKIVGKCFVRILKSMQQT